MIDVVRLDACSCQLRWAVSSLASCRIGASLAKPSTAIYEPWQAAYHSSGDLSGLEKRYEYMQVGEVMMVSILF